MLTVAHIAERPLRCEILRSADQLHDRRDDVDLLTIPFPTQSVYTLGFAVSESGIERALRLRYRVFNEELGEGLMASARTGLDRDPYDDQMAHLVLLDRLTGEAVGTYRLQTVRHGLAHLGTYCAQEYDLSALEDKFGEMVECGRACVLKGHRNYATVINLWRGLAVYMELTRMRRLFGCCSLTSLDPDDGWRAMKSLRMRGVLDDPLVQPREMMSCGNPAREFGESMGDPYRIPKLFNAYLRLGARVVSYPAIDREFGTVDFLVMFDMKDLNFATLAASLA